MDEKTLQAHAQTHSSKGKVTQGRPISILYLNVFDLGVLRFGIINWIFLNMYVGISCTERVRSSVLSKVFFVDNS